MFTLSGIFLEYGINLFRDFWSLFSISFLSFSTRRNCFKKRKQTSGRTRLGHLGPAFLSRDPGARQPSHPVPRTLTLSRHRRRHPPPDAAVAVGPPPDPAEAPRRRPTEPVGGSPAAAAVFERKPLFF